MCAPQGRGPYSTEDVRDVLSSSVTAFAAAKVESARLAPGAGVRIHTGHWGTGVFGGDRVLMAAAQAIAARLTGVGELVYHSLDDAAAHAFEEGMRLADGLREGASFDAIVATFDACGFVWGAGDGN